jgi:hypothetical protein
VPFYLPTRKGNNERKYFQKCVPEFRLKKVFFVQGPKTKDASGRLSRHYGAPVIMELYIQGSGIPVIQINLMRPHPKKGTGLAQGGVHLNKESVAEM